MFKNYIKSTFRFLKRNKLFAGINILGLSLALAASFIILLYIINELSYNHCYKNRKQIYRVVNHYVEFNNTLSGTPYILAPTLKDEFPSVEQAVRIRNMRGFKLKLNEEFINIPQAIATDSEIFDIFGFSLDGSRENILDDQNSLIISQKLAEKLFPGENPNGKEIVGLENNEEHVFVVKAVFDDIPINSTLHADCFVNSKWTVDPINNIFRATDADQNWTFNFWNTWVLLKEGSDIATFDSRFRALESKIFGKNTPFKYSLQNLSDVYLRSDNIANTGIIGSIKTIKIFSAIAFLIILVAAFNYIILSTAVSTGRTREIGVRKTSGASNRLIGRQLLNESVLLALLVLPIALILGFIFMPFAEKLFQTKLHLIGSNVIIYILVYISLTLLIGIVSGLYTSSYLSRLNVITILKNNTYSGKKKAALRYSLIVLQLVIFCSFVSSTLIIRSQYQYALKKDLGHKKENLLIFDLGRNFKDYPAFINTIQSFPEVEMAAGTMDALPMNGSMTSMHEHFEDKTKKIKVEGLAVDYGFLETLGIPLIEGRVFSRDFGSDLNNSIILNETAVKELGISQPIGQKIENQTIIGVVKDFNLHSLHSQIPPLMINMTDRYIQQVVIRYNPGSLDRLLPKLENEWKKLAPDRPFRYSTIEDLIQSIYSSEKNLSIIVSISAIFTLLISALGLFGLTLFITKTQTKQIGIKKVLGCKETSIINTFLRENFILVGIATILSTPITFYFMKKWLSNFAYKTGIHWWIFATAFVVATIVVLTTVFIQSAKASRVNPVEALRYE